MGVCRARSPRSPILYNCACPLRHMAFARAAEEGRIGRLCSERAACLGMHVGSIERGRCAAGLLRCSQRGPPARDVTIEYSRGTPSYGVRCAGTVGAHRCCGCGVVPPERPSPLRVCSYLLDNALNGSVPSWLSALTNLVQLCVAPSCQRRLRACGRGGSDQSALLRARSMSGGCMSGASSGGGAAAGLLRCSQRGPPARDVTKEYSRGTPSYGYGALVP